MFRIDAEYGGMQWDGCMTMDQTAEGMWEMNELNKLEWNGLKNSKAGNKRVLFNRKNTSVLISPTTASVLKRLHFRKNGPLYLAIIVDDCGSRQNVN